MSDFRSRCILRRTRTGAPRRQGLHIGTWVAGPGFFRQTLAHFPTVDAVALRSAP